MKNITIVLCSMVPLSANAQQADTTDRGDTPSTRISASYNRVRVIEPGPSYQKASQKVYHSKDNVVIATSGALFSEIEDQIFSLEIKERWAMADRDEASLMKIWARDFSLDELPKGVLLSQSDLPFYATLSRVVENVNAMGALVFTSGHEQAQKLKSSGDPDKEFRRSFFHAWKNIDGVWTLSIKTYTLETDNNSNPR